LHFAVALFLLFIQPTLKAFISSSTRSSGTWGPARPGATAMPLPGQGLGQVQLRVLAPLAARARHRYFLPEQQCLLLPRC